MKITESKQFEYLKWIIFALIIFLIYRIVSKFGLFEKTVKETETEQSEQATSEQITEQAIKDVQAKNPRLKATLSGLVYVNIANDIYNAVSNGAKLFKLGTDESAIYRAFLKLNNDVDMITLQKVFGVRNIPSGSLIVSDFKGNLPEVITNFLDTKEIAALNNLLAKKGITIRF